MSNKTYDICKWIAQYLLPALATLYFAVSQIWACRMVSRLLVRLLRWTPSWACCWVSVPPIITSRTGQKKASECR